MPPASIPPPARGAYSSSSAAQIFTCCCFCLIHICCRWRVCLLLIFSLFCLGQFPPCGIRTVWPLHDYTDDGIWNALSTFCAGLLSRKVLKICLSYSGRDKMDSPKVQSRKRGKGVLFMQQFHLKPPLPPLLPPTLPPLKISVGTAHGKKTNKPSVRPPPAPSGCSSKCGGIN